MYNDKKKFNHHNADIATAAINLTAGSKSIGQLLMLLNHSKAEIRIGAIEGLRQKRGMEAINAIARCLNDCDYNIRIAACKALGKMRAHTAKRQLYDTLYDKNPLVCCSAASALSIMGDKIGLPHVVKHLRNNSSYRLEALKSINTITGRNFPLNKNGLKQAICWLDSLKKR